MLIAAHSMAAGYLGDRIGDPVIAFIVGIVVHLLLDMVPHYDTTDDGKLTLRQVGLILADALLFIILIFFVIGSNKISPNFLAGAFGGIFPDLLDNIPLWKKTFRKTAFGKRFHHLHNKIHPKQPNLIYGLLTQAVFIVAFSLLLFYK